MYDDKRLDRLESKLDRTVEGIGEINVTLAAQHESLKEHMRRTELLEKQVEPIKRHVVMVHGVLKFLGIVSLIVGILNGVIRLALLKGN